LNPLATAWIYYVSEWAFMWLDIGGWAFDEMETVNRVCVELIAEDSDRSLLARAYERSWIVPAPLPTTISVDTPRAKGTALIVLQMTGEDRPFGWSASGAVAASRDAMGRGLHPSLVLVEGITKDRRAGEGGPSPMAQSWIHGMIRLGFSTPALLRWASPPEDQHGCFYGKCYTNLLLGELARRELTLAEFPPSEGWFEVGARI